MRHAPLDEGQGYGFQIPGHGNLEDQSVNSECLNGLRGYACDVLFDCKNGEHHVAFQIACFNVLRVHDVAVPNANTIRKGRDGSTIQGADIYTFEVVHEPTPCMYPHCEIKAKKNGVLTNKLNSGSMKTQIRMKFADLAEQNRTKMTARRAAEFPKWERERKRLAFWIMWTEKIEMALATCAKPFSNLYSKIFKS